MVCIDTQMDQGLLDCSFPPLSLYFLTTFSLMEKMIGLIIHDDRHLKIKLHQILLIRWHETIWSKAIPICDLNLTSDQTQSWCFELPLVMKIKQDTILNRLLVSLDFLKVYATEIFIEATQCHPALCKPFFGQIFLFHKQDFPIYSDLFRHETQPKEYLYATPLLSQLCFSWPGFPHILADFKCILKFLLHTTYLIIPEETGKLYAFHLIFEQERIYSLISFLTEI